MSTAKAALVAFLTALAAGCWSADVVIANLDDVPSDTVTMASTDTSEDSGTNTDTTSTIEPDTSPCDWEVALYGAVETVHGFSQEAIYAGGRQLDGSLLLSFYDGSAWHDLADSLGIGFAGLVVNDIHGSSKTDVVAVGGISDLLAGIIRWTGSGWQPESASAPPLLAVWSTAKDDSYASARGVLLHYDGQDWTKVDPFAFASRHLVSLWGLDPYDMWGVGQNALSGKGIVVHFDGSSWKTVSIAEPSELPALTGIWGSAANDVYVVGGYGTILHYQSSAWTQEELPSSAEDVHLSVVWGRGASEVYAGGVDSRGEGILFLRQNDVWTVFDNVLPGAPLQLWSAPGGSLLVASDQGLLLCR